MTDAHYSSYAELLEKVEWDKYGVQNVSPRTAGARTAGHCGYEPTASLGLNAQRGDTWKNIGSTSGPSRNRPASAMRSQHSTASLPEMDI